MSEQKPEDEQAARPQVINLEAEEIKTESQADKPDAVNETPRAEVHAQERPHAPPPPPTYKPARKTPWVLGALVIGLLAGGWLYRDVLSSYLPTNEMAALKARVDAAEANGKTLSDQLAGLAQAAEDAKAAAASADQSAKSIVANVSTLSGRTDDLATRIASAEDALKGARSDLDALKQSIASLGSGTGTTGGAVDSGALAALSLRIDALEKDVASLKSQPGGGDTAALTTALSQALSDLKAKVAAGAPFPEEYARIARMVPAAAGLDVLESHAEKGLPAASGLAAELRALIPTLPQPEAPAATDDSYWGSFLDQLSGIITIRDIGESDWPALAEKVAALTESGDVTAAIAAVDGAEGAKPPALSQWRDRAQARLSLEAALAQVAEAVLRQIAAIGGQP